MVEAIANGNELPILPSHHYSKGIIFILTVPDNFSDLYSYPPTVVSSIKNFVLGDFPVRLDGPNQVSLFAYDNHTFVVESVFVSSRGCHGIHNRWRCQYKKSGFGRYHRWKAQHPAARIRRKDPADRKPHKFSDISTTAQLRRIYRS